MRIAHCTGIVHPNAQIKVKIPTPPQYWPGVLPTRSICTRSGSAALAKLGRALHWGIPSCTIALAAATRHPKTHLAALGLRLKVVVLDRDLEARRQRRWKRGGGRPWSGGAGGSRPLGAAAAPADWAPGSRGRLARSRYRATLLLLGDNSGLRPLAWAGLRRRRRLPRQGRGTVYVHVANNIERPRACTVHDPPWRLLHEAPRQTQYSASSRQPSRCASYSLLPLPLRSCPSDRRQPFSPLARRGLHSAAGDRPSGRLSP